MIKALVIGLALALGLIAASSGGSSPTAQARPGHPLGLFRLASLCPQRPHYFHPGIPRRQSRQKPLLRHRPVRHLYQSRNLGSRPRPQRAG